MRSVIVAALLAVASRPRTRRHVSMRKGRRIGAADDMVLLGDLIVLGLLAGMPFPLALRASSPHVNEALADEIRSVLRASRLRGSATVFGNVCGPLAPLLGLAARAATTGAPMIDAVAGFTTEERNAERARALVDARRVAVRMLFPLALLILPGFVLLVAGPVVIDGLARVGL